MDDSDATVSMHRNLDAVRRRVAESPRLCGKVSPAYGVLGQCTLCCIVCGAHAADSGFTCVHLDPASGAGRHWKLPQAYLAQYYLLLATSRLTPRTARRPNVARV